MAIKPVLRMGNPKLLRIAEPVTNFDTQELHTLIEDMQETQKAKNGVGIAAPQIDVNLQVIAFGFDKNPRYPNQKPIPSSVLINPEIKIMTDETEELWEGCLCVPGLRGLVKRYTCVHYRGYDPKGNLIEGEAKGFHARILQHETDHLKAILFPARVPNLQMFGFEEELAGTIEAFYAQRNKS